jgi:triphosphoribosyl-dephospho-CoA synthetase
VGQARGSYRCYCSRRLLAIKERSPRAGTSRSRVSRHRCRTTRCTKLLRTYRASRECCQGRTPPERQNLCTDRSYEQIFFQHIIRQGKEGKARREREGKATTHCMGSLNALSGWETVWEHQSALLLVAGHRSLTFTTIVLPHGPA